MQILKAQTQANTHQRYEFCQEISERIENNPDLLDVLLFNDEAHFHLSGLVNKQSVRFWASSQPHEHVQAPLSVENTTVWCAIGRNGIFGPYFCEGDDGQTVTEQNMLYSAGRKYSTQ